MKSSGQISSYNFDHVALDDVAEKIVDGPFGSNLKTSDYVDDGIPVLQGKNITNNVFKWKDIRYITEEKAESLKRSKVYLGDHLLIKIGSIGYSAIFDDLNGNPFAIIPANMAKITPNLKVINSRFLHHWLTSIEAVRYLKRIASKTAQPALSLKKIKTLQVPLPPITEQKRIAAILDKADALREKRRQAMTKLDKLLQSVFLDIFGDPVTNPKGWDIVNLADAGSLGRGISKHRPRNAPELLGGPYPLIQTGEVANSGGYIRNYTNTYSEIGLKQSKIWPKGTLCITIAANIANTGILTFDACFPDSVVGFVPNERSTNEFIQHLFGFLRKILEEKAPQVAQKNINLSILRSLPIPLPDIRLQQKFSKIIGEFEKTREKHRQHIATLDNLFSSLQQRAFKGDL